LVCLSCFLVNGIIFGIINTFGIILPELVEKNEGKIEDPATKCSLIGSLAIGTTFCLSFLVGVVSDKLGLKLTSVIGGVLATLGMGLSCLFYDNIYVLYLTYGVMFGAGASLIYTPSLTILGHYFKKYLGIANGIVTAGSSIFTIAYSYTNQHIVEHYGLLPCLQLFTCLCGVLILCALTFTPVIQAKGSQETSTQQGSKFMHILEKLVYLKNWRNKKYVIWTLAIPLALFGYFVPYVHLPNFAEHIPLDEDSVRNKEKAANLIMCIGITGGIGRIISGLISDHPKVNPIVLQQVSFLLIGLCTMLLVVAESFGDNVFEGMLVFCCIMGVFDGCFITMIGPIAFSICGPEGAGQAIGFLLAMCSLPLTLGPPVAGLIFDKTGSYTTAFLAAGVPPIVGAVAMTAIRLVSGKREEDTQGQLEEAKMLEELLDTNGESSIIKRG